MLQLLKPESGFTKKPVKEPLLVKDKQILMAIIVGVTFFIKETTTPTITVIKKS